MKLRIDSPPKNSMMNSTSRVVIEVIKVRDRVLHNALLKVA